jgi:D-glycero-alpha-D-manno-heptose-7-phosphate kinase
MTQNLLCSEDALQPIENAPPAFFHDATPCLSLQIGCWGQLPVIIRSRAPLRLGLAGGGTDLSPFCDTYGGYVLNATIDLYAYAHIYTEVGRSVRFVASEIGEEFEAPAESVLPTEGPLALHKAVYNRIVRQFGEGRPLPLRMVTYCDAPPGSGLGSSSTLVVAMIKAFVEWLRLPLGEYDIARMAFEIERRELGFSGGRQDQYAATFGGFNFMEFYAHERVIVNPLRIKNWILSELETSLVLYFTGVSRVSAGIIDEQTRNVRDNDAVSIEAMKELKEDALGMKEAVLKGDFAGFAARMGKSWAAKKLTAKGVSNANIDTLFDLAMEAGAVAGKISGAGGGGFAIFIVDPARRTNVIRALQRTAGEVRACHFTKHGSEGWRLD